MSMAPRPPIADLIPENAPFTPAQRTWLNGFFAGLISSENGPVRLLSPAESAALSLPLTTTPGEQAERSFSDQMEEVVGAGYFW